MRLDREISRARGRCRASGFAPLLTALLAVFLQAFVVQTHIHTFGVVNQPAIEARGADAAAVQSDEVASSLHKASCLFCAALSSSSRATLPAAAKIDTQPSPALEASPQFVRQPPRLSSHAWRSRAPPIQL